LKATVTRHWGEKSGVGEGKRADQLGGWVGWWVREGQRAELGGDEILLTFWMGRGRGG